MKKLWLSLSTIAVVSLVFVACNNNGNNSTPNSAAYAVTPQPCNTSYYGNSAYGNPSYNSSYNSSYYNSSNYSSSYYGYGGYPQNNYGNYATTPGTPNYANQQVPAASCANASMYTNYQNPSWYYGQWYWPNQYQPTAGNCGCPNGYSSVYSQSYGVACMPSNYGNQFSVVYWNVNWYSGPAQNSMPLTNAQAQYPQPSACNSTTAQGCDTRQNNCPAGSRCQPAGGGSTIGLCVQ